MADYTERNLDRADKKAERHMVAKLIEAIKDLQESIDALAASIELSKED